MLRLLVLCVLLQASLAGCARDDTKYPVAPSRDGGVAVDLAGVEAGGGRFLTFRAASGKNVDFLVYRDGAGAPHAVLDACRTCYRWKKGYLLDRGGVICVKCDMRFALDDLAQGTGSCVPIALTARQSGGRLLIPAAELEEGARYF